MDEPMTRDCLDSEKIDGYVSGELGAQLAAEVATHLADCRECATEVARRAKLRSVLEEALGRRGRSASNDELKSRILHAIETTTAPRATYSRLRKTIPLGAALIVSAVAVLALTRAMLPARDRTAEPESPTAETDAGVYSDVLINHLACAVMREFPEGRDADASRRRLGPYAALLDTVSGDPGYELVHAHVCPNRNRAFGHLVVRHAGETISLFVTRKHDGASLPPADGVLAREEIAPAVELVEYPIAELAGLETPLHMGFIVTPKPALDSESVAVDLANKVDRALKAIDEVEARKR